MPVKTPIFLQNEITECGAIALQIILAYYGRFVETTELRSMCGVSRDGVRGDHLAKAAKHYGLTARSFRKNSQNLKNIKPPFVAFMSFNHFLVIEGFSEDSVYVNDPAYGRLKISLSYFEQQFTGIIFTFEPSPTFKRSSNRNRLFSKLLPYLPVVIGSGVLLLCAIAMLFTLPNLAYPALLRSFMEDVLLRNNTLFIPLLLITLLVFGISVGLALLQHQQMLRLESQVIVTNASKLMWRLLHLPDSFFTQRSVGEIGARFALVENLGQFFSQNAVRFVFNAILITSYLLVLTTYHPLLPLLSLSLMAIYMLCVFLSNRQMRESAYLLQGKTSKLIGTAVHVLQNIENVKASGGEADAFTRLAAYYTDMQNASQSLSLSKRFLTIALMVITVLNTVSLFIFGILQVQAGLWSISMFAAVYILSLSLWNVAISLIGFSEGVARLETEINRLDDVLHEPKRYSPPIVIPTSGAIQVNAMTFGYKSLDRPLFENLSLKILANKTIGLVGLSGSGKTTLARLIAGIYQPQQGEIERGDTTLVDQDIFLFEGTIWENLTFWDNSLTQDTILQATQDAEIHAEILQLPQQYDTVLMEHARNLSGGQRQRLQIARALAMNSKVLILDEATSALDPILERQILQNIRRRDCTLIIVSHRWSAVQDCDEIWVMENGQIVERGTHAELWQNAKKYTQLVKMPQVDTPSEYTPPTIPMFHPMSSIASHQLKTTLHMLSELVNNPIENLLDGITSQDATTVACTIIGRELGFAVHSPITDKQDRVQAIADASHVYVRRVLLPSEWWKNDCGAFIAHKQGVPIAFLRRGQQYLAIDPSARHISPVNASTLAEIETTVYQFYPPLLFEDITARKLIMFLARNNYRDWQILILCGILIAVLQMIPALLMGGLFDTILPEEHLSMVGQIILALLGSMGVVAIFTFVRETVLIRIQTRSNFTLQSGIWTRLFSLPPSFFRQFSAGDLVMRIINSKDILQGINLALLNGVFYILSLLIAFIFLLVFSASLAMVGLLLVVVYLMILIWIGQGFFRNETIATDQRGRNIAWIMTLLQGVNHLQIAGALERVFGVWAKRFTQERRTIQQVRTYENRLHVLNSAFPLLALLALFVSSHGLTLGTFMTAQMIFLFSVNTLTQLGMLILSLLRMIPSYQRLAPILHTHPETLPGQQAARPLNGEILLQDITFRYHATRQPALQNLSLHIKAGEFLAVVGASGSGKSTLLRILLGFEQAESGSVYYDQQHLAELDPRTIREQIGIVLQQHNLIYSSSILNNIAGSKSITLDEAWAALRFAGLEKDVLTLPMGIHTLLNEGGKTLSAGQRQRLLIARAVARRPRLLFLDEATNALDDQTQAVLIHHLSAFKVTRFMIAHRLSSVLQADRIIVLDKGQIVENGTYDVLMAQNGLFTEYVKRQMLNKGE